MYDMENLGSLNRFWQGEVNPDGKVFWEYQRGKPVWLSREKFLDRQDKKRKRAQARFTVRYATDQDYRARTLAKNLAGYYRNRAERVIKASRYSTLRRKQNPLAKLSHQIGSLIRTSFGRKGLKKRSKTETLLGCSIFDFRKHIENQFLPGMTWENREEWHVDHIIPIASARTDEELMKLNHYTNLRPLWTIDNLKKGAKVNLV